VESLLAAALDHAEQGNAELRELAHGILPSVLTSGGLRAGVDSLVSRLGLPVEMDVTATRLPPEVEASVYFVVAEALTNVVKHSQATRAQTVVVASRTLRVEVRDDGIGGSRPRRSRVARHGRSCGRTPRPAAHRHFARRRHPPGRGAAAAGLEILASIRYARRRSPR
jgi:signal transduction histidine kinase